MEREIQMNKKNLTTDFKKNPKNLQNRIDGMEKIIFSPVS